MSERPPKATGTRYQNYILREDEHPGGLLDFQTPYGKGRFEHPDELLFIITHQTFELWFKEVIEEILRKKTGAVARMARGDLQGAATTVRRLTKIARVLADQYGIVETITPSDFLRFRDVLRPSSGYDSAQFRAMELASGLRGDGAYLQHLAGRAPAPGEGGGALAADVGRAVVAAEAGRPSPVKEYSIVRKLGQMGDVNGLKLIAKALSSDSLRDGAYSAILKADVPELGWPKAKTGSWTKARAKEWREGQEAARKAGGSWDAALDANTAAEIERRVVVVYHATTSGKGAASRPLFELLEALIEYDEVFRNLRAIHINMVLRVIGGRPGTGGSSGANYLRTTLAYSFFPLLWRARDHMEGPNGS